MRHIPVTRQACGRVLLAALFSVTAGSAAFADRGDGDGLAAERRMVYFAGDGAMSTFKSKVVEQNDTGTAVTYAFGATVGEEKDLEFRIRTDSSTIPFALNASSIASKWQDTLILYHFPYFYVGAGLGTNAMTIVADGAPLIDVVGSGYGGTAGLAYPIAKAARIHLEAIAMAITSARELEQKTVAFGARTDVNLNVVYDLTRTYFDIIYGYRYRTYTLTVDGVGGAELHSSTYLGLQFGFDL